MIPVKLALRNFMPYRDNVPPLIFTGIHTASIWGDNGNGKSALIDAMTWALWGKTRAKSDDDLVHSGQTETEVEFDFAVGQQTYRVIRKHARPKRRRASGRSSLDLLISDGDGFKVISGNSMQQTQQEIIKLLHMDYPTFINSALLLQGRADEFTVANPSRRKQVLADILGLSVYDNLEEQARELVKQQETEAAQLETSIQDMDIELARKPVYESELKQAESELSRVEKVRAEQESGLTQLRQKKESLENSNRQLTELEGRIQKAETDLKRWDDMLRQHNSRIKEYEELINKRASIEEGYTRYIEARTLYDELEYKFRQSVNLERQKMQLDAKIREAGQSLLTEHAVVENRISELEANARKIPQLKNELQQIQVKLNQLSREEDILSRKRQDSQELRGGVGELESSVIRLEKEIGEIEEKLGLLHTESGASCPLCETELGADGMKIIETKYNGDKDEKSASLKQSRAELDKKKTKLGSLEGEISRLESRLNQERMAAQSETNLINQRIAESDKASQQLDEERAHLTEIEESLAKKDFAAAEQEALKEIESELARLNYEPGQHEQVRNRLRTLEQYESPKRSLEEADKFINREKESARHAEQTIEGLRSDIEEYNMKRQELAVDISLLPQINNELAQAEIEHQSLSQQQKDAQETVGNVKGKLERCSELETKKKDREELLSQASKEEKIYRELVQAFGKKGIQAWLIEMVLPEIETEANKLLGRMTDNRMHVKIETQRETKKGDLLETLDINISDELGMRNYEMFSGGEAFRINFAIRIALSKLLARRSGAPLPTLIIDEGFGTQDNAGLEKIKEAITYIQDDFDKILVITHIEEFRDAFPVRIDVTKTAQGSTIEVN